MTLYSGTWPCIVWYDFIDVSAKHVYPKLKVAGYSKTCKNIQGVSGGIVNILEGGSMDYSQ